MNRFIAAIVFASAQAAIPIPQPKNTMSGAEGTVGIPSGKWDITSIQYQFIMVSIRDPVWAWAGNLNESNEWASPDGYAMIGEVKGTFGGKSVYGVGIQPEGVAFGNMAVATGDGSDYHTIAFNLEADFDVNGPIAGPPNFWDKQILKAPGEWSGPAGNGEEWGQKISSTTWNLWSYNDSAEGVEDWEDGKYDVLYV